MRNILIDANIYLRFYDSNATWLKKLLHSIEDIESSIFITQQIVNEINRNKLNVFTPIFKGYLDGTKVAKVHLPEHLENDKDKQISQWNSNWNLLMADVEKRQAELKAIYSDLLNQIMLSNDKVSISLNRVYKDAFSPSQEEINKAKLRKEIGNPPGKKEDPLGDQLSWEQFLSYLRSSIPVNQEHEIYIVSQDFDYFILQEKDIVLLNPILVNDLKMISEKIVYKCYSNLGDFFKSYREAHAETLKMLPSNQELESIAKNEFAAHSSSAPMIYYNAQRPTLCVACNGRDTFTQAVFKNSIYGGLTRQFICMKCGYHFDTGEPFD